MSQRRGRTLSFMSLDKFPLPDGLKQMAELTARAYGLTPTMAALVVLNAVGLAIGTSVRVRTLEYRDQHPAINLVGIQRGAGLARTALLCLLEPIRERIAMAACSRQQRGVSLTQAELEAAVTEHNNLAASIARQREELDVVREDIEKREGLQYDELVKRYECRMQFPQRVQREQELATSIDQAEEQLAALKDRISTHRLENRPHLILDDCSWGDIPNAACGAVDNCVMVLSTSPKLLLELNRLSQKQIGAIAKTLHRSHSGLPTNSGGEEIVPAILNFVVAEEDMVSTTLGNGGIATAGLFEDFLFCDVDDESAGCDVDAMSAFKHCAWWKDFQDALFIHRLSQSRRTIQLDEHGVRVSVQFAQWRQQFGRQLNPNVRRYFAHWGDLALRLALLISVVQDEMPADTLPVAPVEATCAWLMDYAPIQADLLTRLIDVDSPEAALERGVMRVVERLRKVSPRSLRDIARTFDVQHYTTIRAWLDEGVRRGLIEQRESNFFALNVSVSASASRIE